jgi:hypothetical protein
MKTTKDSYDFSEEYFIIKVFDTDINFFIFEFYEGSSKWGWKQSEQFLIEEL